MIENLLNEVWKPIDGFDGLYEISNYSRIKSTKFKLHRIINPNGRITENRRYLQSRLRDGNGNSVIVTHHRIAALHFVINRNPKLYTDVNHIDGNRMNNHVSNFEWTTHRENTLHGKLSTREGKSSKYKGVSYVKANNNWRWAIYKDGKHIRRFAFKTEEEAYADFKQYHIDNGWDVRYLD